MCKGWKCAVGCAGGSLTAVKRCLSQSLKEWNESGINLLGGHNWNVLKVCVRCNAGHHRVWRAMRVFRRDQSGHTMQGNILAATSSDWLKDPWTCANVGERASLEKTANYRGGAAHVDWFLPCYNSYLFPWLAPSVSAFFFRGWEKTSLLVTVQAGLIGGCILKVTLGKNAGTAALPLSGCFVSVPDCVEAPKQACNASRACLLSQRACDSQERKVWIRRLLYFEWLSTQWISTSS